MVVAFQARAGIIGSGDFTGEVEAEPVSNERNT